MMKELSVHELESQEVELLPSRETLWFDTNIASVYATNSSLALNAGSFFSDAHSVALQSVIVSQG
ncbi:hypothetical protein [Pseudarthrobacter sp. DSP2-3-2b1]|uniref:hypothetical protein n=1 Tax=Pseudarthrobacter sp. DSP2-3-2b1 TaxID=2804661 RepID=UPI003CF4C867